MLSLYNWILYHPIKYVRAVVTPYWDSILPCVRVVDTSYWDSIQLCMRVVETSYCHSILPRMRTLEPSFRDSILATTNVHSMPLLQRFITWPVKFTNQRRAHVRLQPKFKLIQILCHWYFFGLWKGAFIRFIFPWYFV